MCAVTTPPGRPVTSPEVHFAVTDDSLRYDERSSLHPLDPKEGLRRLLRRGEDPDEDDAPGNDEP